jgi:hypothetical protein
MTDSAPVRRKRRRSRLFTVVGAIVVVVLAVVAGYGLWTVYENTLTPAALGQGSANASPSVPGRLSPTASRALEAYGGEAVWRSATQVESTVTVGGLLFQLKGGFNLPPHASITVDVHRPYTVIQPVDPGGDRAIVDGFSVTVISPAGRVLEQRADAREHLQNASVTAKWDRVNLVYFLGYAFWGYYALPALLTRNDVQWTQLQGGVLQADFGPNLPVHSRIQRFWFDKQTGLLKRNDYTPVAAARDARAAHIIFEHKTANGIPYPSKRRVKISLAQYGWVLPFPDLITIDVESWQLR